MSAVVAAGGAGLAIAELEEDGSTGEPTAFPIASASWKVLVPVWAVEPSIAVGSELEPSRGVAGVKPGARPPTFQSVLTGTFSVMAVPLNSRLKPMFQTWNAPVLTLRKTRSDEVAVRMGATPANCHSKGIVVRGPPTAVIVLLTMS